MAARKRKDNNPSFFFSTCVALASSQVIGKLKIENRVWWVLLDLGIVLPHHNNVPGSHLAAVDSSYTLANPGGIYFFYALVKESTPHGVESRNANCLKRT